MKKAFIAIAAGLSVFAACSKPEKKAEIPALINASFTSLTNKSVEAGSPNKLTVTAAENGAELTIVFYSDMVYLANGTYSIGTAAGNYSAHYKDQYVDNDVVSGSVTVALDENDEYNITGALKLNNTDATLVKIDAKGKMEYELPAEYLYTKTTADGATVYNIYTLGESNELLAMATVCGEATGTFTINNTAEAGTAKIGSCGNAGTFLSVDKWGKFMLLSGTVKVSEKSGKLNFAFNGTYSGEYNNCQPASSVNVPKVETPRDGKYYYKYFFAKSALVENAYECTAKSYTSDFKELFSSTVIVASEDFYLGENQGKGLGFGVYPFEMYSADLIGKLAINNTTYVSIDGVNTQVPDGYYVVINDRSVEKGYAMIAPIDANYVAPEPLWSFLGQNIWSFGSFVYPTE